MIYLLDTHIFLWWLSDDKNLSAKHVDLIKNPKNTIYLSAVSIWEISIKRALKKLHINKNYIQLLDEELGLTPLPINFKHADAVYRLKKHHQDPFDHLLIAQAWIENAVFITVDSHIKKYKEIRTI